MKFLFFVLFVTHSYALTAQTSFALTMGGSFSWRVGKSLNNFEEVARSGLVVTQTCSIPVAKHLRLNVGLHYLQKNFLLRKPAKYGGIQQVHSNGFIGVPLSLEIPVLHVRTLQINLSTGVFANYWVRKVVSGTVPNVFSSIMDPMNPMVQNLRLEQYKIKNQFSRSENRIDVGISTGLIISARQKGFSVPLLHFSYQPSLTHAQAQDNIIESRKRFRTLTLSVGIALCNRRGEIKK